MHINFKYIKIKNFMSYGNAISEYYFDNSMTLLSGLNGYGKSTIFIALFYNLYGRTYKKNKLGSLINNINNKDMYTEVCFTIDNDSYIIKRGQKPSLFEIYKNNEIINQHSTTTSYQDHLETNILKISESSFRQLIFLGANVIGSKTFVDLTKSEKEELFQLITDTAIFSVINENIKMKEKANKTTLSELQYKINVLTESIEAEEKNIRKIEEHNKSINIEEIQKYIDESNSEIDLLLEKKNKYKNVIQKLKDMKPEFDKVQLEYTDKLNHKNNLESLLRRYKNLLSETQQVKKTFEHCIGCSKLNNLTNIDISKEDEYLEQINNIENIQLKSIEEYIETTKEYIETTKEKFSKGKILSENIKSIDAQIESFKSSIESKRNNSLIEISYTDIDKKRKDIVQLKEEFKSVSDASEKLKSLAKLLSNDNLKGVIINQQLPILNKYINDFLQMFSRFDFQFYIDSSFKENILSKSKDFEFHSLSNGQSMRVLFSIMFAFLQLVEDRNGVSTNILILDEVLDSSIDSIGRYELLNIIKRLFAQKEVIIISHNPEVSNYEEIFTKHIKIEQQGKFSKIILS